MFSFVKICRRKHQKLYQVSLMNAPVVSKMQLDLLSLHGWGPSPDIHAINEPKNPTSPCKPSVCWLEFKDFNRVVIVSITSTYVSNTWSLADSIWTRRGSWSPNCPRNSDSQSIPWAVCTSVEAFQWVTAERWSLRVRLFCWQLSACLCLGYHSFVLLVPMSHLHLLAHWPHPRLSLLFVEVPLPYHDKTKRVQNLIWVSR